MRVRSALLSSGVRALAAIGRRIPLSVGRAIGRSLGSIAWHVARRDRRKALANIAIAFPQWSEAERRRTIRAMFRHLGMSLFETVWLPNLDDARRAQLTTIENVDALLRHLRAGRGVIAITGHCGNWEWVANVTASMLLPHTMRATRLPRRSTSPRGRRATTWCMRCAAISACAAWAMPARSIPRPPGFWCSA